jgi:ribosome-associated translation inhibitor RaiA
VEIVFHAHHAKVSDHMRRRVEREVRRAAARIPRVVEAIVRFEEDGRVRRVSVLLRAPRHHEVLGRGEGRYFGPALTTAISRVLTQARREKRMASGSGARREARARSRART